MASFIQKPHAIRKVVTNPDGTTSIVYVDAKTNKVIKNPTGYNIIEAKSTPTGYDPNITSGNNNPTDKPTLTDQAMGEQYRGERASEQAIKDANADRSQQSLGYINKPSWAGWLGFLPAPFGTVATIGNLGTNASNTAEVNKQREVLGFTPPSMLKNVGSTLMDKQGYIGDASYQDGAGTQRTTPVSFEAEDKVGRTTLTPDEARMREQLNPTFQEATVAEQQNAVANYESLYGKQNPLSSIATAAKGLFSNLFGTSNTESKSQGGGGGGYSTGFPDAPSKPTGTTPTGGGIPTKSQYDRDGQGDVPDVPDTPGLY